MRQLAQITGRVALVVLALVICGFGGKASHGTMKDSRDGKTYKTTVIASQTWMAENLNYEYKVNGSTYGNWCYNNSLDSCAKYGRLYTWGAAMDTAITGCGYGEECAVGAGMAKVRGVCPTGWLLPRAWEWENLFTAVGGLALKTNSEWYNNGGGTDAYGFSAFPSGLRIETGDYSDAGFSAVFWSSSKDNANAAKVMALLYNHDRAHLDSYHKNYGFAVRCVKD